MNNRERLEQWLVDGEMHHPGKYRGSFERNVKGEWRIYVSEYGLFGISLVLDTDLADYQLADMADEAFGRMIGLMETVGIVVP